MEGNNYQGEIEEIRQHDRDAMRRAYENIHSIFDDERSYNGINAVLNFFHEKDFVNESLPLSEQLEEIEANLHIKMRYVELESDWYRTSVIPMMVKTTDGRYFAVMPRINGSCSYIDNGRSIPVTKERAKQFMTSAMCFYKSTSSKSYKEHNNKGRGNSSYSVRVCGNGGTDAPLGQQLYLFKSCSRRRLVGNTANRRTAVLSHIGSGGHAAFAVANNQQHHAKSRYPCAKRHIFKASEP